MTIALDVQMNSTKFCAFFFLMISQALRQALIGYADIPLMFLMSSQSLVQLPAFMTSSRNISRSGTVSPFASFPAALICSKVASHGCSPLIL